jgi:hypothetical protein
MSRDFNQRQYSQNYQQYLDNNVGGNIGGETPQKRIEILKRYLPIGRKVFEIGSGGGLDAILLQRAGYKVIASDYVDKFVSILKKSGLEAINFDAKHDELPLSVDCIYANAVFVHFSPEEISSFSRRVRDKLTNEKMMFISVLKGKGYERSARSRGFERDFYYYTKDNLKKLFQSSGYKIIYLNDEDKKWIQMIVSCR